jgi:hypothetical protein
VTSSMRDSYHKRGLMTSGSQGLRFSGGKDLRAADPENRVRATSGRAEADF